MQETALEVRNVTKTYRKAGIFNRQRQLILKGVSFTVPEGHCLGIIGESGSGKSTLGRLILGVEKPDSGDVLLYGKPVRRRKNRQKVISAVFQDYTSSICPNQTVYSAIYETLQQMNLPCDREIAAGLMERVGLDGSYLDRYQHELSGGQTQRVCIARVIATHPKFLVLDEAISSLDVTVQVQILQFLKELREETGMSYLFITHDIQAATFLCDSLIFFNAGQIVEQVAVEDIAKVKEPYSQKLLHAVITV